MYHIKSFVRREGRITKAQQRALHKLSRRFIVNNASIFNQEQLFSRQAQLVLDIGFGNGDTLAHMCATNTAIDFIGVEVYRPGIGHLLLRATEMELTNLRIIYSDIVTVLEQYITTTECLDFVQIFFPDPWPKCRQHKRRLIQTDFINKLVPKIKLGGIIYIMTDCEHYAMSILEIFNHRQELEGIAICDKSIPHLLNRKDTKFESKSKILGQYIWEIVFRKIAF